MQPGMEVAQSSCDRPLSSVTTSSVAGPSSPTVKQTTSNTETNPASTGSGASKPKQSKSRNGCVTCKAKRLKCDETKPTCRQCQKRNVSCGGYKKDFKWRQLEGFSFVAKAQSKAKKSSTTLDITSQANTNTETEKRKANVSESETTGGNNEKDTIPQCPLPSPATTIKSLANTLPSPTGTFASVAEPQNGPDIDQQGIPDTVSSSISQGPSLPGDLLSDTQTIHSLDSNSSVSPCSPNFPSLLAKIGDADIGEIVGGGDIEFEGSLRKAPCYPFSHLEDILSPIPRRIELGIESPEVLLTRFDRRTCGILSVKDGASENPWRTLIWPLAPESPAVYHAICSLAAFHNSKETPSLRVHGMKHMRESIRELATNLKEMRIEAALATTLALAFSESWDRHISTGIEHLRGAKLLFDQALAQQQCSPTPNSNDTSRLQFLYNTWVYTAVMAQLTSLDDTGFGLISASPFFLSPTTRVHKVDPLMGCATTLFPLISRAANLVQKVRSTQTNSIALISQAIELKTQIERWSPPRYFEPPEDPTSEVQHSFQTAQAYRWATLLHLHQAVPEIPSESAEQLARRVLVLLATVPLSSRTTVVHIFPLLGASCEVNSEEDRLWVRERWEMMQSRLMIGNIDRCLEVICEVWARRDQYALQSLNNTPYVVPIDTTGNAPMCHFDNGINTFIPEDELQNAEFEGYGGMPEDSFQHLLESEDLEFFTPSVQTHIPPSFPTYPQSSGLYGYGSAEYEKTVRGRLHWIGVMKDWNWEVLLG